MTKTWRQDQARDQVQDQAQDQAQDLLKDQLNNTIDVPLDDRSAEWGSDAEPPRLPRSLRPNTDACFALLDGRPVLFSEAAQKLYELNQTAAYIWCSLLDGKPTDAICADLENSGLGHAAARSYLQDALRNWLKLGLLQVDWALREEHTLSVRIGKLTIDIQTSSQHLRELLLPLFSWSARATANADDTFEVIEIDGQIYLFHNKTCIERCAIDEVAPILKARLTEQIVARCAPDVAFHAACLLSRGKGLLVSGPPGAGKTTLTLHLLEAGFEFGADDIVLIAPDGSATGVPFAPTLKTGAWAMIDAFRPELGTAPVHNRPDGLRVRYLDAPRPAYDGGLPVGWIVFIDRQTDGPAQLTPLSQLDSMTRLIDGSYSPDGKLSHQAFQAIKRTLVTAPSFELTYSNAAEARDILVGLCNAQP